MAKKNISAVKLGFFVIAGLLFLVLLLYMIGKNESLFGSNFKLKARFGNVQGLNKGNNVRYLGQQVGTVKSIAIINDTLIEVTMLIKNSMKKYINRNAVAAIGTDGLVGNKLINISPGKGPSSPVADGDIIAIKKTFDTDEMLQTLGHTNDEIVQIVAGLKTTVNRINNSTAVWDLLNDEAIPASLKASLMNIRQATMKAGATVDQIGKLVDNIENGKGSLGAVLTDTSFAVELGSAIKKINSLGTEADHLAAELNAAVKSIRNDIDNGKGPVNMLLKDSSTTISLQQSMQHIEEGTNRFNEVMEALKHNLLLRGYFRKQEKKKQKEAERAGAAE